MKFFRSLWSFFSLKKGRGLRYKVEKIVFDVEWNREVLILKSEEGRNSVILSLELDEEYQSSVNSHQLMMDHFETFMQRLGLKVKDIRLFHKDLGVSGQARFFIGNKWKTVPLSIQECISLSLLHDLSMDIDPQVLELNRLFRPGQFYHMPQGILPLGLPDTHFENEVVM